MVSLLQTQIQSILKIRTGYGKAAETLMLTRAGLSAGRGEEYKELQCHSILNIVFAIFLLTTDQAKHYKRREKVLTGRLNINSPAVSMSAQFLGTRSLQLGADRIYKLLMAAAQSR